MDRVLASLSSDPCADIEALVTEALDADPGFSAALRAFAERADWLTHAVSVDSPFFAMAGDTLLFDDLEALHSAALRVLAPGDRQVTARADVWPNVMALVARELKPEALAAALAGCGGASGPGGMPRGAAHIALLMDTHRHARPEDLCADGGASLVRLHLWEAAGGELHVALRAVPENDPMRPEAFLKACAAKLEDALAIALRADAACRKDADARVDGPVPLLWGDLRGAPKQPLGMLLESSDVLCRVGAVSDADVADLLVILPVAARNPDAVPLLSLEEPDASAAAAGGCWTFTKEPEAVQRVVRAALRRSAHLLLRLQVERFYPPSGVLPCARRPAWTEVVAHVGADAARRVMVRSMAIRTPAFLPSWAPGSLGASPMTGGMSAV